MQTLLERLSRIRTRKSLATFVTRIEDRLELLLLTLKIANLLAVKHDYIHRRTSVLGRPIGYLIDAVSGCNLGCPSCPQTSNKAFAEITFNPWPKTIMKPDVHDKVCLRSD
jgi:hypothetical protein